MQKGWRFFLLALGELRYIYKGSLKTEFEFIHEQVKKKKKKTPTTCPLRKKKNFKKKKRIKKKYFFF